MACVSGWSAGSGSGSVTSRYAQKRYTFRHYVACSAFPGNGIWRITAVHVKFFPSHMAGQDSDPIIKIYLREIMETPLLTPQEEIELATRAMANQSKTIRLPVHLVDKSGFSRTRTTTSTRTTPQIRNLG